MTNALRNLEIWIVEDEIDLSGMLNLSFTTRGHRVVEFSKANDFLEAFGSGRIPHIVISDIRFPIGVDGRELLKVVKQKNHFIPPVILMTAYEDYDISTLYNDGAESIFQKPFDLQEIELAINRLTLPLRTKLSLTLNNFSRHLSNNVKVIHSREILDYKLGRGGLCIKSTHKLRISDVVDFTINIRELDNYGLEIIGIVRWLNIHSRIPKYGVEIISVNSPNLLGELLGKTKPLPYIPKETLNL